MITYVVADTETCGLKPPEPPASGVVQLAWQELTQDGQRVMDEGSYGCMNINPGCDISPEASAIHGKTNEDVKDCPTLEQAMDWTVPLEVIGHNISFDMKFFGSRISNLHGTLCTLDLARQFIRNVTNHKLQTLADELGLERGTAHDAGGDVYTTVSLLNYIMGITGRSLPELVALQAAGRVYTVMPFGKYKGVRLSNLPLSYVRWFMGQDIDDNLRQSFEMQLKVRGLK